LAAWLHTFQKVIQDFTKSAAKLSSELASVDATAAPNLHGDGVT